MGFPGKLYGICQRCGFDGSDRAESDMTDSASTVDEDAIDTSRGGTGMLEEFEGKILCPVCVNIVTADRISKENARKWARKERFLRQVGFVSSIT